MALSIVHSKVFNFSLSHKSRNFYVPIYYIGFSLCSKHRELATQAFHRSEIEVLEPNQGDHDKSGRIHLSRLPFDFKPEWTIRGLLGTVILIAIPFFLKKLMDEEKRSKRKVENKPSTGQKVRIEIPEGAIRPVGNGWPQKFTTEINKICRSYAVATCWDWPQVEESCVDKIHESILEKFDIDLSLPHVKLAVNLLIQQKFRGFRYKLYKHFREYGDDGAQDHPFDGISQDDWNRISDHFMSKKLQSRRRKQSAKQIRPELKHSEASKSFMKSHDPMAHSHESQISNKPLADEEIRETINAKPDNIFGLSYILQPNSTSLISSQQSMYIELDEYQKRITEVEKDADEAKKHAEEAEKRAEELKEKVETQQHKIEELEEQLRKLYSTGINTE